MWDGFLFREKKSICFICMAFCVCLCLSKRQPTWSFILCINSVNEGLSKHEHVCGIGNMQHGKIMWNLSKSSTQAKPHWKCWLWPNDLNLIHQNGQPHYLAWFLFIVPSHFQMNSFVFRWCRLRKQKLRRMLCSIEATFVLVKKTFTFSYEQQSLTRLCM